VVSGQYLDRAKLLFCGQPLPDGRGSHRGHQRKRWLHKGTKLAGQSTSAKNTAFGAVCIGRCQEAFFKVHSML
jgi:hypothetical protein